MLALSRRTGERVLIGDNIWVTLIEAKEGRARLGFDVPKEIPVMREELLGREEDAEALRVD
jgi:carbon storage regulator